MVFRNVWPTPKFKGIALASTKGIGALFFSPNVCKAASDNTSLSIPQPTPSAEAKMPSSHHSVQPEAKMPSTHHSTQPEGGAGAFLPLGYSYRMNDSLIFLGECLAERKAGGVLGVSLGVL